MAAITPAGRQDLVALYLTMFGRAPTTVELAASVLARESGSSLEQVATTLSADASFALVASKDGDSFALYLADALLAADIDVEARDWGINWVVTNLSTMTKAQVIATAIAELRATDNPLFASSQTEVLADVIAALDLIDNPPVTGQTLPLTIGVDIFTGTNGGDSFLAGTNAAPASNTLTSADSLDGGGGVDTLYISLAQAFSPVAGRIKNIENIVLQSPVAGNFDLSGTAGVTSVDMQTPLTGANITGLNGPEVTMSISNAAGTNQFTVKNASLTGTADVAHLTVSGATGILQVDSDAAGNTFEEAVITSTGAASNLATGSRIGDTVTAGNISTVTKLTVKGDAALTLPATFAGTILTEVDASAMTAGGLTINTSTVTKGAKVTGGGGNDVFTGGAGNDTVAGGAGNDSITAGAGNDNVDGGAGNDTVTLTAVTLDDTIAGGDGTDTLSLGAAVSYSTTTDNAKHITGFETLSTTASITQDMTGLNVGNTITKFESGVAAGSTVLQNVAGLTTVAAPLSGTLTLGLKTNGTTDALAVSVGKATGTPASAALTLNATQYETLTIDSIGANGNSVTTGLVNAGDGITAPTNSTATSLKSITITGTKNLTVTTTGSEALATVNAAAFTGESLTLASSSSKAAMTVTANGSYMSTITTGTGADSVTSGAGNDVITTGAGTSDGNDTVSSGDGNDTINVGDGSNVVDAGTGDDTVTASGTGSNSITGGDGNDTITTGTGNDTIVAGAGNDNITSGSGSDSIVAGDGNDTISAGTGDDTILGGAGNDSITLTSLSSGDSIDGGDGNDSVTVTSITSDATPAGIANVELLTIGTIGSSVAQTVDFTKVSGITSLATKNATTGAVTLTIKNLPTTMTTLSFQDSGAGADDTLALSFAQTPSAAVTLNVDDVSNTATNVTSVGALNIVGKLGTDYAGTARTYDSSMASTLGTIATDSSALAIKVDALSAAVGGVELTTGAITANAAGTISVASSNFADVQVGAIGSTSVDLTSVTLNAATNSTLTRGNITANSTENAVTYGVTVGDSGALKGSSDVSFTSAAVTVTGTLGTDIPVANFVHGTVTGKSIAANTWTIGSAVGTTGDHVILPTIRASAVTDTIGATTINVGAASFVDQSIGTGGAAPKSIGAITVSGSGSATITLSPTNAALNGTANAQGAISAAGMTSSQSSLTVVSSNTILSALSITGGSGNDVLAGGVASDTITGGAGVDGLTGNSGADLFVFSAGHSSAVFGSSGASSGQDTITDFVTGSDLMVFNITSADTTWDIATHIVMGTGSGGGSTTATLGSNDGAITSYATSAVLVQAGNPATANDGYDIVVNSTATLSTATARAGSVINLTGTIGADTLTTGQNNDTVNGGLGNDTITAAAGADSMIGGGGDDTFVLNQTSSIAGVVDRTKGTSATLLDNLDTVTFAPGSTTTTAVDVITDFGTTDKLDVTTAGTTYINLGTGAVDPTVALVANSHYYIQGTYVASTGVFTVNSAATASTAGVATLVVADATAADLAAQTSVVILVGVVASDLTTASFT